MGIEKRAVAVAASRQSAGSGPQLSRVLANCGYVGCPFVAASRQSAGLGPQVSRVLANCGYVGCPFVAASRQSAGSGPQVSRVLANCGYAQSMRSGLKCFGDRLDLAFFIDAGQGRFAFTQQYTVAVQKILVFEFRGADPLDAGFQSQQIVIFCRLPKMGTEADDDHEQARLFHLAIVSALGPQQFCPAHLEEDRIIRVVQKAHRVGLFVAHAELDFVFIQHERFF
jgi:hypothetical protein